MVRALPIGILLAKWVLLSGCTNPGLCLAQDAYSRGYFETALHAFPAHPDEHEARSNFYLGCLYHYAKTLLFLSSDHPCRSWLIGIEAIILIERDPQAARDHWNVSRNTEVVPLFWTVR